MEAFAAVFAAAIHDVDHPGYTNQYLINSSESFLILTTQNFILTFNSMPLLEFNLKTCSRFGFGNNLQ
jgi:cAMP-specific phosphodiesterase 4